MGLDIWKLPREAYKPHITNSYAKKIQNLIDDEEEYVIGVANDWRIDRMVEQIQLDKSGVFLGIKEVWFSGGKKSITWILIDGRHCILILMEKPVWMNFY